MKLFLLAFILLPLVSFGQKELELRVAVLEQHNQSFNLQLQQFKDVHNAGYVLIGVSAASIYAVSRTNQSEVLYITSGLIGLAGFICVGVAPNYLKIK